MCKDKDSVLRNFFSYLRINLKNQIRLKLQNRTIRLKKSVITLILNYHSEINFTS